MSEYQLPAVTIPDDLEQYQSDPSADQSPFLVHQQGPDDIVPVRTWLEAVTIAHVLNSATVSYEERTASPGLIRVWATPYSREDAKIAGVI